LANSDTLFEAELAKYKIAQHNPKSLTAMQEIEFDSINRGFSDKSYLQIYYMPELVSQCNSVFAENNKIIVVSNSLIETSQLILNRFFTLHKITYDIASIDIHNTAQYGSKSDSKTWFNIFSKYKTITNVYDDKYLLPALQACGELGFNAMGSAKLHL
jgi:hypothetical protein